MRTVSTKEINKGISRVTRMSKQNKDFCLPLATDSCRYVKLYCQDNGILLTGSMDKPESGFVVPYDTAGRCRLPGSVMREYDLCNDAFELVELDSRKSYFLKKDCVGKLPEPMINNLNYDDSAIDLDKLAPLPELMNRHCKMQSDTTFSFGLIKTFGTMKITVHTGKCMRIDVAYPTKEEFDTIPDYQTLRKEYWHNFADYCGEQLSFIYSESKRNSFPVPQPFRLKAGLSKGDHLDGFIGPDVNGHPMYIFAPKATTCGLCGEVLNPIITVPNKEPLCSPCASNEDKLEAIHEEMKTLRQLVGFYEQELAHQDGYKKFIKQLEELQADADRTRELNAKLSEEIEALNKKLLEKDRKIEELLGLFGK